MDATLNLVFGLSLAALGPIAALAYLKPLLLELLRVQCPEGGRGAEFWIRSAQVLAVCGTLLLTLSFGLPDAELRRSLERVLWLVAAGTFSSVAWIASTVWAPVRHAQNLEWRRMERELARQFPAQKAV